MVHLEFEISETDEFVSIMIRLVMGHKWWSFENKGQLGGKFLLKNQF